jgi:hypothetical protein
MKKLVLFLSILLTTLSCTKDDASQNQDSSVLPKKIIHNSGKNSHITTFSYNGNKIAEVKHPDGTKSVYTYTDDLISNITEYEGTNIIEISDYFYENGKIKNIIGLKYSTDKTTGVVTTSKSRTAYTHNNGTITEQKYNIDLKTGVETKNNVNNTFTYENGNLKKAVYFDSQGNFTYTHTIEYEYDNKKNQLLNITGLDKIAVYEFSINNVIKETISEKSTTFGVSDPVFPAKIITYTNIYNANNFISESQFTDTVTPPVSASYQYFYE